MHFRFRSFRGLLVVTLVLMLAAPVGSASARNTAAPIQAVLHGSGCGDPIRISAVSRSGDVTQSRVLVRGKPGFLLSARQVSRDGRQFLFTSWNCETKEYSLYRQSLVRKPTAELLMALPAGWWMEGVTWDVARNTPAVLFSDANFNYQIQVLLSGAWTTLWAGTRLDFGGKFPKDLKSRSGFEYLIVADAFDSAWSQYRMQTSGSLPAYPIEVLTGPGRIQEIANQFPGDQKILVGPDGSWICDWSAQGTIQDAIAQGKCATVPGGNAYRGVVVSGPGDSEWLILDRLGPSSKTQFTCVGSGFVSCGTPVVGKRGSSSLRGNGFAYAYFGERGQNLRTKFKNLGSSRV